MGHIMPGNRPSQLMGRWFLLVMLLLTSCSYRSHTPKLSRQVGQERRVHSKSAYYLVILVDAPHLDYSNGRALLKTVAKHPSDGRKNGDVGHAWIYLHGTCKGICFDVQGGHSGERGMYQATYFEGIMNYIEFGCANPTYKEMLYPKYEPDPVKYLWESQKDGFFQPGAGGHKPTFAVKINLTKKQYLSILTFIDTRHYDYTNYAITGNQCCAFVAQVAQIAGLDLDCEITLPIPKRLQVGRKWYQLWRDPKYSSIIIASPDILERSLKKVLEEGRGEYALSWYFKHRYPQKCLQRKITEFFRTLGLFPYRYRRAMLFKHN